MKKKDEEERTEIDKALESTSLLCCSGLHGFLRCMHISFLLIRPPRSCIESRR